MLPTEKASSLVLGLYNILEYDDVLRTYGGVFQQHLYIISDDILDIKEGDWCYDLETNSIRRWISKERAFVELRKIIATTDNSLAKREYNQFNSCCHREEACHCKLPQIPESFITAYMKAYNEGKPITEVDLEIEVYKEYRTQASYRGQHDIKEKIKTRPDNTVIILPIIIPIIPPKQDKLYTKDEVEKIIRETCKNAHKFIHNYEQTEGIINKWIKDNL